MSTTESWELKPVLQFLLLFWCTSTPQLGKSYLVQGLPKNLDAQEKGSQHPRLQVHSGYTPPSILG